MSVIDMGSGTAPSSGKNGGVKTLAIRLEPDLHAELSLIAQLREQTITDEIRQAIEAHVAAVKANPDLATKADDVLADIERQATARRDAFARLFSDKTSDSAETSVDTVMTESVADLASVEKAAPQSPGPASRGRKEQ